jgi:predicted porin
MKKLVIAAAVLGAFAGTAQAQSSVTLFGVVDTNVTHLSSSNTVAGVTPGVSGSTSRTFFDNSGINSSRLGFRGTEDLGGGLKAGFWLEIGMNTNNGSGSGTSLGNGAGFVGSTSGTGGGLTFNRRSTVSLIGQNWGEVRLGRDYVPTFWNAANVDPFGYNGIGEIASFLAWPTGEMGPAAVRASNGVSYLTPNTLGGFFLQATYALGGNPSNYTTDAGVNMQDDGNYAGINVGYQNGPLYAGVATGYTSLHPTNTPVVTAATPAADVAITNYLSGLDGQGGVHTTNFGVSYDLGVVKPDFFWQTSSENTLNQKNTIDVYSIGAVVPLGQGEFRANYNHASGKDGFSGNTANIFGVGYIYNLSKRTALYGLYAHVNNSGNSFAFPLNFYTPGPGNNGTQSGVSLGLRTSF